MFKRRLEISRKRDSSRSPINGKYGTDLRPRLTLGPPFETDTSATSLQSQELERLNQVRNETVPSLPPNQLDPGLEPVATAVAPNANPAQMIRPDREQVNPAPRTVRAVPVARNE